MFRHDSWILHSGSAKPRASYDRRRCWWSRSRLRNSWYPGLGGQMSPFDSRSWWTDRLLSCSDFVQLSSSYDNMQISAAAFAPAELLTFDLLIWNARSYPRLSCRLGSAVRQKRFSMTLYTLTGVVIESHCCYLLRSTLSWSMVFTNRRFTRTNGCHEP